MGRSTTQREAENDLRTAQEGNIDDVAYLSMSVAWENHVEIA